MPLGFLHFIYFTGYTPNGVKWRGKRSLHFNKTRVKSHNSKNKGKSPLETKTGARTPSSLIQMVCLTSEEKKCHSGGKTYSDYMCTTEALLFVTQRGGILLAFGMIYSLVKFSLWSTWISFSFLWTQTSLSWKLDKLSSYWTVSEFPWLEDSL